MKNLTKHNLAITGCFTLLLILSCGCEMVSEPAIDYTGQVGIMTDVDGNTYKTVGIGTQIWMAENLRTTKFNDGTTIPEVKKDTAWIYLNEPGLCWYNNDSARYNKDYGALYNYFTVNAGKICPEGWHVPAKPDWKILVTYLGGDEIAGGKLKNSESTFWNSPNPTLVNNYGFNALPGGSRRHTYIVAFIDIRNIGNWWTSGSSDNFEAQTRSMSYNDKNFSIHVRHTKDACSIRCVKD